MRRIKDEKTGTVHFACPGNIKMTLCAHPAGDNADDLFGGTYSAWPQTGELVNCPRCAQVYCAVKNEPWNTREPFVMETLREGTFAAVVND